MPKPILGSWLEVVTDKEIAEAEAFSTFEAFVEEHGMDNAVNVIPEKEKTDWVASYTGGYDANLGEQSESVDAFEILWLPYASEDFEKWSPKAAE